MALRGADLRDVPPDALDRLNRLGISTTLVVTLKKGLNDGEIGRIIDFALAQPGVRGVTLPADPGGRPTRRLRPGDRPADAHRSAPSDPRADTVFRPEDVIPGAVSPGQPGHGVRAQDRRQGAAADRADRPERS